MFSWFQTEENCGVKNKPVDLIVYDHDGAILTTNTFERTAYFEYKTRAQSTQSVQEVISVAVMI